MARQFLEKLPKIPLGELPTDSTCMICLDAYGTESLEKGNIAEGPVRLPCGHHVGAECISIWLSPDKTAQNSCPYCRARFFAAQSDPDSLSLDGNLLQLLRRIRDILQPSQDSEENEEWEDDDDHASEDDEESLQRALAVSRPSRQPGRRSPAAANNQYLTEAEEAVVVDLLNLYRTLLSREMALYVGLISEDSQRLPSLSELSTQLDYEQEEALFLELERRGAFARDSHPPAYAGLTSREIWQSHRENGEVWDPQAGEWFVASREVRMR